MRQPRNRASSKKRIHPPSRTPALPGTPRLALRSRRHYPIRVSARKIPWIELGILAVALLLRVASLDIKPAHFDEGVNGWFADQMTRQGYFRYDPTNYHGPLHFYEVFLSQTLFGRNLWALRAPAILSSVLAVWLVLRFRPFFSETSVRLAALAMAVSPACVFYGRYSIHESTLMLFQILFFWGLLGVWQFGARKYFLGLVGAAVGLVLTKETYVLHIGSFALAALVLWGWQNVLPSRPSVALAAPLWTRRDAILAAGLGVLVIVFFYSGNFLDFTILKGLYETFAAWFHTGVHAAGHEKTTYDSVTVFGKSFSVPVNWYWVMLLGRYEWPALIGLLACFRFIVPSDARLRLLAIYAGGVLLAYSLIPYKTPWCILSIVWPFFFLFGAVVDEVAGLAHPRRRPVLALLLAAPALAVSAHAMVRLNFERFDDPKEPYVYVQTFRESRVLTDPILGRAAEDPRFYHVRGQLFLDSYYPLPWIFGDFPQLGYYKPEDKPVTANTSDFVVADKKDEAAIEKVLSGDYYKRDFRLRDAQGDCVVYFRADTYQRWFPGETPTSFVPDESP